MKLKQINIKNYKLFKDFKIDFLDKENNILNLIVIAGINGSGKTTLFEYIIDSFNYEYKELNGTTSLTIDLPSYKEIKKLTINGHISHKLKELYGENAIDVASEIAKKIIYLKVSDNQKDMVISQIKNFIDMIKDNNEELTIKEANQKATDEINSIFNGLELKTKFKGISKDIKREILFENDVSENIHLEELSTGEQQLFIRALSLKMMSLKDSIILIDEPEISLHPNWQNHILKIYNNIAKSGNNQLIVATHSPQIISSTPNESLRVLIKNNINIEAKKFNKTYGSEIEEVLADFMDTKYLRTPEVSLMIEDMWKFLNTREIEAFEIVYDKLIKILDINDNDLVLARLQLAKQKS